MSDTDGVDRDTPGGRPPRAWETAQRLRLSGAANDDAPVEEGLPAYAELHCLSDFSFLRGAASAEELFERAVHVGYEALAITDECSLAGIVRALEAARVTGIKLIVGSEFTLDCGLKCVLLVDTPAGYTRLCELITQARRAAMPLPHRRHCPWATGCAAFDRISAALPAPGFWPSERLLWARPQNR